MPAAGCSFHHSIPSVATTKQHIPRGIDNPEAYCDLCQKGFCIQQYFLKRYKVKMHGIVPPDGSGTIDRDIPAVASSSGSSHKSTSLRSPPCSRRRLLFDGGTTSCSSSSSSSGRPRQQQLFSPERLRQMGIINAEEFCEI